ncbi:MAG: ATP-binding cassette domain-containing protein [Acidobacteria bacterium]|nr:ATP-binding cassette domain-containing protein [Acidobacteriota bacterium]MYH30402.1 ATP-binding cassette domain-containing protein [Acidobacteriota bacterium]
MLHISNLHKAFGDRVLFDKVSWQLQPGQRVGLCGPNGAGKTTLLKMLSGEVEADAGEIARPNGLTVGYLPQDGLTHAGRTLYDETSRAFEPLLALQAELRDLEIRLGDTSLSATEHDAALARYSEVQTAFQDRDGYGIEAKVDAVLRGLGFEGTDFEKPTETFSGGWQMRIALAKLLLRRPRLLLLDEPTNHLDLEARNWLEDFLVDYPDAVVLVSHDRYFLDSVVTEIAEVGLRTLTEFRGTYSAYLTEREARIARLREAKKRQDEEVARMRLFIDRFRYKATKAKQVQSRVKMLEKITPIEVPAARKRVHFKFPASAKSGRTVVELRDVAKAYGDVRVFERANVHIERGDRVALVGPNGAGKSTLMRMLSGVEAPDRGERIEGYRVITQYFAQDEAVRLDGSLTVYETLASGSPVDMVPTIRNILGGFLFTEDDVYKRVKVLSGGERTRLAVARMLLRPSNTLILDEPTNHLDIDSTDVLLDALTDYGGTLIFVSHDRYFVDRLATKIIDIGHGEAALYPGTYEEFRWSREQAPDGRTPAPRTPGGGATGREGVRSTGGAGRPSRTAAERRSRPGPDPGATGTAKRPPGRARAAESTHPDGHAAGKRARAPRLDRSGPAPASETAAAPRTPPARGAAEHKRRQVEARRQQRKLDGLRRRIADLEKRIAEREEAVRKLESEMAAPGFFTDQASADEAVKRHQKLMWEVGDLMNQWEALEQEAAEQTAAS